MRQEEGRGCSAAPATGRYTGGDCRARRAEAARDYLVQVDIPSDQLHLVSYGKERPLCQDHDEACLQRNRRIHIIAMAQ